MIENYQPDLFKTTKETRKKRGKIFLLDANSLIHRAFHALPTTLVNSKGEVVNAAYGFTSMLIRLLNDFQPEMIVAAFDSKTPTFRHDVYKDYKANRPETAEELIGQFPIVKEILNSFGIPIVEIEGYEADDILATLALKAKDESREIYIVSGDRDMLQLVNDSVKVLSNKKGISEIKVYNRQAVIERFGVNPEQIPDFLALKGEPGDNIPGVPGIGEKTAASLVSEYGSLEKIYENLEDLKGKKIFQSLSEHREQAFLSKMLALLSSKAPIDESLIEGCFQPDLASVKEALIKFEFISLLERIGLSSKTERLPRLKPSSKAELLDFDTVSRIASEVGQIYLYIDEKTGSVIAACADERKNAFSEIPDFKLAVFFQDVFPQLDFVCTNDLKKLAALLSENEVLSRMVNERKIFDLQIAQWLLDPDKKDYSPDSVLKDNSEKSYVFPRGIFDWAEMLSKSLTVEGMTNLYNEIELPIALILAKMEKTGVDIDLKRMNNLAAELQKRIEMEAKEIYKLTGYDFNINSPQQLAYVLYQRLKLKKGRKVKQHYSTDFATLSKLIDKHPSISHILHYRELFKLKTSFVEVFLSKVDSTSGKLSCNFIQTGTATGRIASEDPNLQNIPLKGEFSDELRQAINPGKGNVFVGADYSQVDLRMLAHISSEERLIEAFCKSQDIHSAVAAEVFGVPQKEVTRELRRVAKIINFSIVYGVSPQGLSEQASISFDEAERYIYKYFQHYPRVKAYMDAVVKEGYEKGYVSTIFGRRRYLPGLQSSNVRERSAAERLALNSPIQGSSADVIKLAMIKFERDLASSGLKAFLVLQVHDSLIAKCAEGDANAVAELLKNSMEQACELKVPLETKVSVGKTLADV